MSLDTDDRSAATESAVQAVEYGAMAMLASLPRDHVAEFLPSVGRMTTEMVREIQQAVPAYAQPLEGRFGTIMVTGVEQAVRRVVEAVGMNARPDRRWASFFHNLGRVEFHEGRSLDSLQTAYRVGGRVAWRHIADWGMRKRLPMATLTVLAEAIFAYIDEISKLSIAGYTQAQSESTLVTERKRRKLTEHILAANPDTASKIGKLASSAGWRIPREVAVVALEWTEDSDELPAPTLPNDVLMDLDGQPGCLITANPAEHLERLSDQLAGRRACVGPTVRLRDAKTSLRLARRGLDLVVRGILPDRPVTWCDDHLATLCVLGDEFLIGELLKRTLQPLDTLTDKQRERTVQTTLAWLESRGSVPDIARKLDIHPQTVRYRMRMVDALFGDQLDDPDRRLDLEIALRTRQIMASVDSAGSTPIPS